MPAINTVVGGSIDTISIAGREFAVAADAEAQLDVGGVENTSSSLAIARLESSRRCERGVSRTVEIQISDDRDDRAFLDDIAFRGQFVDVTCTLASGVTWGGRGALVGRVLTSAMTQTAPITLQGDGTLEKL